MATDAFEYQNQLPKSWKRFSLKQNVASYLIRWAMPLTNGPLHFSKIEKWNFDFLTLIKGNFFNFTVPQRPGLEKFLKKVYIFVKNFFIFALKIFWSIQSWKFFFSPGGFRGWRIDFDHSFWVLRSGKGVNPHKWRFSLFTIGFWWF